VTFPAADLPIAACAHHHGVVLEATDTDFALLATPS
jgi:predicted nucleic acid-binding protein